MAMWDWNNNHDDNAGDTNPYGAGEQAVTEQEAQEYAAKPEPEADVTDNGWRDDGLGAEGTAGDGETDGAEPQPETEETGTEETETAVTHNGKKPRNRGEQFPRINTKNAARLLEVIDLLRDDETALGVARYLTGVRRGGVAELIDALTDGRNKQRIRKAAELASELAKSQSSTRTMYLVMAFASNTDGVAQVYELMHAVAPDSGLGRTPSKPVQDKWDVYATDIAKHWPETLDIGMVERLSLMR